MKSRFLVLSIFGFMLILSSCQKNQSNDQSFDEINVELRSTLPCDGGNTNPQPVFLTTIYSNTLGECCFRMRFSSAYNGMKWSVWTHNTGNNPFPSSWTIVPIASDIISNQLSIEVCVPSGTEILIQITDPNDPSNPNYVWACWATTVTC